MEQYIPKSALVAEIDRQIELLKPFLGACAGQIVAEANAKLSVLEKLNNLLDTLGVKEVDLDAELEHYKAEQNIKYEEDINMFEFAKHFFELGVRKKKEEKYEVPSVSKTEDVSVTSRMAMIDDDLKPIAEFILDYAGWNLHKDEWNHPVLEVPLFRVLDALIQRGKPYCGKN